MQLRNRNSAASDETAWSRITRRRGAGPVDAWTRGADHGVPEKFLHDAVRGPIDVG